MARLDVVDLVEHGLERADGFFLVGAEWFGRMEVLHQHHQGITDTAQLAAIIADIVQNFLLDLGSARLAKIDVDQADLAVAELICPRADELRHISGKRQFECGHLASPV